MLQFHFPKPDTAAVAATAIGGDVKLGCLRITIGPELVPPTAKALDREAGGIAADPDADPTAIVTKSCTRTSSGVPLGRYSRPPFLKSPTNSFFFVSTEITTAGWRS